MTERIITVSKKDKNYSKYLEIFIKRYDSVVTQSRNDVITFLGWFVTLIIVYITYKLPVISYGVSIFLNGNWVVKFILISVTFTTIYFTYRITTFILRLKYIDDIFQKIFGISNFISNVKKLNQLHLAYLEFENWELKVKIDDEKGILELIEITKSNKKQK